MDTFGLTTLQHNFLQRLEILGDRSLVTLYPTLQFGDDTHGLAALVDKLEGARHLSYLHRIDHLSHLRGQVLHLEARGDTTRLRVAVRHQSFVVAGILIVGEHRGSILEGELLGTDIVGDGVETTQSALDSLVGDNRLTQDMAHIDLVATLLDKLDDMETELGLDNL